MTVVDLLTQVREAGGGVWLEAAALHYRLPIKQQRLWLQELRTHKAEIFQYLLEQEAKTFLRVACTCSEKAFPHFRHDTPVIPRGAVLIKGNLQELSTALAEMQGLYGNNWKMWALLRGLEQSRKERKQ